MYLRDCLPLVHRVDLVVTSVLLIGEWPSLCKYFTSNPKQYSFVSEETKQKKCPKTKPKYNIKAKLR